MHKVIYTDRAPRPIGPYSQGIISGNMLFISGQIPVDPKTNEVIRGDFREAVRRVLENIKAIVEAAGGKLSDIVKVTVYLKDISKFNELNEVYKEYFKEKLPARTVIEVSNLPRNADLEVEAIAILS